MNGQTCACIIHWEILPTQRIKVKNKIKFLLYFVIWIFCSSLGGKPSINRYWHFLKYLKEQTCNKPNSVCITHFSYLFSPTDSSIINNILHECYMQHRISEIDLQLVLHISALSKYLGYLSTSEMLWSYNCSHWVPDTLINLFTQHTNTYLFYLKLAYYIHSTIQWYLLGNNNNMKSNLNTCLAVWFF